MQLTDTQLVVLSTASQRPSDHLLPLPATCKAKGGAADKVIAGLVKRGLATLVQGRHLRTIPAGAEPWRTDNAGEPLIPLLWLRLLELLDPVPPGSTARLVRDRLLPGEPRPGAAADPLPG